MLTLIIIDVATRLARFAMAFGKPGTKCSGFAVVSPVRSKRSERGRRTNVRGNGRACPGRDHSHDNILAAATSRSLDDLVELC